MDIATPAGKVRLEPLDGFGFGIARLATGLLQGLFLAGAIILNAHAASQPPFCQVNNASAVGETARPLAVATDARVYQRKANVRLCVRFTNVNAKRIYVRKIAGWGESSSISIWIVDAVSGREADSDFIPDEIDPPPTNDKLTAVEAGGQLFWKFDVPLGDYKLQAGHSYKAWVFYHGHLMALDATGASPVVTGRLDARAFSLPFVVN